MLSARAELAQRSSGYLVRVAPSLRKTPSDCELGFEFRGRHALPLEEIARRILFQEEDQE